MDLKIDTYLKEDVANILFSNEQSSRKRIMIRRLKKKGLSKEYINMFLSLINYTSEV